MKTNRKTHSYRFAVFVIAILFVLSCLVPYGCKRETPPTQQTSSTNDDPQKEMIEHVIAAKLPESVRNCRYHSKSYGMGSGTGWGYFEISRADLSILLDSSDHLPDASEFGQDSGAKFNIEKYLERTGESIAWWKPLTLQKRRYAQKILGSENVTGFLNLMMLPGMNICVGEIREDWLGVYLVYHCG
jgi:hypothetical protein